MLELNKQKSRLLTVSLLLVVCALFSTIPAGATSKSTSKTSSNSSSSSSSSKTTTTDLSSGVARSYNAAATVQIGMVVQNDPKKATTVIPLSQKNIKQLLGVVIPNENATIVLTPDDVSQQQVLVSTTGTLNVLVSNQNGAIKSGDYISISSLDGIAMKAGDDQDLTLGRADAGFDGKQNVIGTMQVKNSLGQNVTVSIGRVLIDVGVTHNPSFHKSNSDYLPGFIGRIVFEVTSKQVSAARVYFAMLLLIGLIVITANMLYGGVRGSMIALGRNPLSKKSITLGLLKTALIASSIFVGGVAGIYFFLKL